MGFFAMTGIPAVARDVERFLIWCGRGVEDRSGHPSVKRIGLIMAVTVLCMVMAAFGGVIAGIAMSITTDPQKIETLKVITNSLENIAGMVLLAVTTGYLGGKGIERMKPATSEPQ